LRLGIFCWLLASGFYPPSWLQKSFLTSRLAFGIWLRVPDLLLMDLASSHRILNIAFSFILMTLGFSFGGFLLCLIFVIERLVSCSCFHLWLLASRSGVLAYDLFIFKPSFIYMHLLAYVALGFSS
jgi:hypothetical protein